MRAVVQRVSSASVTVDGELVAEIDRGLLILLGVGVDDSERESVALAGKVARLRIFENEDSRFDHSLLDVRGEALVVSQFTLLAETGKGNRPSFSAAAVPERAEPLYATFCTALAKAGVEVSRGIFGARMEVALVNSGPVTVVLEAG